MDLEWTRVKKHQISTFDSEDGALSVFDQHRFGFIFTPVRVFWVHGARKSSRRGRHAHKRCHQFVVAVNGSFVVDTSGPLGDESFLLDSPAAGLHIPPLNWDTVHSFSVNSVCLVIASHPYDVLDYIEDKELLSLEWDRVKKGGVS